MTPSAEEFIRPFRSHWLSTDEGRIHYLDEGPRDAPALVMLHGNPTWCYYYRYLVSAFRDSYRVIVPDHLGCGLSDKPQHYAYTLDAHIGNLETLIAEIEVEDCTLLMHDWGGAIGMGYATRHPGNVRRTVVFNTAAFFVPRCPLRIRVCRIPLIGALLVRGLNGFSRAALSFATSQPARFTPEVRAGYLAPYSDWANRIAVHAFVRDIPLEPDHPTRAIIDRIDRELSKLSAKPMLILWGADDFCFTEKDFLPPWRERFPNAEVHVLDHAGHYVVEDAHERIIPLLETYLRASDNTGT